MLNSKLFLFAPVALAAGAIVATPASAAGWGNVSNIKSEIAQFDRQLDRHQRNGALSRNEARDLQRKVDALDNLFDRYKRGGFTRAEATTLSNRLDSLQSELAREIRKERRDDRQDNRDDRRDDRSSGRR